MSELIREFWRIIVGENPEVKQALEEEGVALLVEEIERKDDTYTISIANTTMTNIERILYDAINKPLSSVEKGIRNANRVIEQTRALTKREEIPELTPELAVLLYEIASVSATLLAQQLAKLAEEKVTISSINSLRQLLETSLNYIYKFKLKVSAE